MTRRRTRGASRAPVRTLSLILFSALSLSGCGSTAVTIDSPSSNLATTNSCRRLLDALPERVAGRRRRATSPPNALGAAWGNPAIVLRCGVGRPEGYTPAAACQVADGIDWFVPTSQIEDQGADVTMTTLGRVPRVEVQVPASYRPPVAVMVDLVGALKAHTHVRWRCQ